MKKNTAQKTILFTGGGSAGHVTPNLALIEFFKARNWAVVYVGSAHSIEKDIIERLNVIPYYAIATGKLRRYFSWRTFLTPFQVLLGMVQSFFLCRKLKPSVVFSKGGFVALPVVVGAWLNRIPVISHESDLTPGLANRLSFPFTHKICVTFPEGKKYFKNQTKVVVTGTPIRRALQEGNRERGLQLCGFKEEKPVLMVYGGGQGAENVNRAIRNIIDKLLINFQVVHLCGKGKIDPAFNAHHGYKQFEYLHEELADVFACADLVVSRAGANSIYELLTLKKPHVLIPLSTNASRGDQIINAHYFEKQGVSTVIEEENLSADHLLKTIHHVYDVRGDLSQRMNALQLPESVSAIYELAERELVKNVRSI